MHFWFHNKKLFFVSFQIVVKYSTKVILLMKKFKLAIESKVPLKILRIHIVNNNLNNHLN